jgi:hypothetical protein
MPKERNKMPVNCRPIRIAYDASLIAAQAECDTWRAYVDIPEHDASKSAARRDWEFAIRDAVSAYSTYNEAVKNYKASRILNRRAESAVDN